MKKFLAALIISFAFIQSSYAIPSNLGESLIEYDAILNSPLIQTSISQAEFIIDIKRVTKSITATTVFYEIKTLLFETEGTNANVINSDIIEMGHHSHTKELKYKVKLLLTPNPQIGPPLVDVVSITPISKRSTIEFENKEAS